MVLSEVSWCVCVCVCGCGCGCACVCVCMRACATTRSNHPVHSSTMNIFIYRNYTVHFPQALSCGRDCVVYIYKGMHCWGMYWMIAACNCPISLSLDDHYRSLYCGGVPSIGLPMLWLRSPSIMIIFIVVTPCWGEGSFGLFKSQPSVMTGLYGWRLIVEWSFFVPFYQLMQMVARKGVGWEGIIISSKYQNQWLVGS